MFNAKDYLSQHLTDSGSVVSAMLHSSKCRQTILTIASLLVTTFKAGNKLLIFGNGGSAADAEHIAAEFVGRYHQSRCPLPAIALTTPSVTTSLANDFAYDRIFISQVQALAKSGDVLLGISTSGKSTNVFRALAITGGAIKVLFTGADFPDCLYIDHILRIPSTSTPIIQQGYMVVSHAICGIVEQEMSDKCAKCGVWQRKPNKGTQ